MNKLTYKFKNYLSDDSAVADEVGVIIKVVLVIGISTLIGFFAYNFIANKANTATELANQENPGAGNEFSNSNPFSGSGSSSGGN